MSMPTIPDMNPDIIINRDDAVNIIITSIAMEELSIAHILNAEGEKLQYVLGTLEGRDPGEVTICDIMAVNNSVQKTLRDVIKTEMLLQLKLEDAVELSGNEDECQLTIRGEKIWKDGDNVADTRPEYVTVNLLRDGVVYKTAAANAAGGWRYRFASLPVWRDSENKYTYTIDEAAVPMGYTSAIDGFNIINIIEPGLITIDGEKIWVDSDNVSGDRPTEITVNLLQNGVQFLSMQVISPTAPDNTVQFIFDDVPRFDDEGNPFVYTVDEDDTANYSKNIDGFNITNTHIITP